MMKNPMEFQCSGVQLLVDFFAGTIHFFWVNQRKHRFGGRQASDSSTAQAAAHRRHALQPSLAKLQQSPFLFADSIWPLNIWTGPASNIYWTGPAYLSEWWIAKEM